MTRPRIVIAGGNGALGLSLARYLLDQQLDVVILSRSKQQSEVARDIIQHDADGDHDRLACVRWDARTMHGDWAPRLEGAAGLVNLAGRTVDCVKTSGHCDEILRSRVESTRVLGEALHACSQRPPVWVQMSTAHIYGDPPEVVCDESSAFGYGLAPTVGKAWEQAMTESAPADMRQVMLRTSFVVARGQGALARLEPLARWGLGGTVGSGNQGMSWIHHLDMNRLFHQALTDDSMHGAYIASAPHPVSNRAFMRALRRAVGMPVGLPAFSWMIHVAAPLLLRTDPELALYGRYVVPTRLQNEGFEFKFPQLEAALADVFANRG